MEEQRDISRRCGQVGEGEDDVMTLRDVLKEEAQLRAEADAVLGDSDETNCSYPKGYVSRQAMYACATCTPDGNAGICLACSNACHEGHDVYELYTKRNFRCDCGNEKFGTKICTLYAGKMEPNTKNRYSQNFKGAYCSCHRPYPDPDDDTEDEMIQCVVCEDWYHGRHLNTPLPENEPTEMICPDCMSRHSFLWAYQVQENEVTALKKDESPFCDINVDHCCNGEGASSNVSADTQTSQTNGVSADTETNSCHKRDREDAELDKTDASSVKKFKPNVEANAEPNSEEKNVKEENSKCALKSLQRRQVETEEKAAFWLDGWRGKLCRCEDCLEMYKDRGVEFLLEEADTVSAYEERGRRLSAEAEEGNPLAEITQGMGRVAQIELIHGMNDLQTNLTQFLEGFAREDKVVTAADIQEFFEGMREKRRRADHSGVPQPFCR